MKINEEIKSCAAAMGCVLIVAGSIGLIVMEGFAVFHYIHIFFPLAIPN